MTEATETAVAEIAGQARKRADHMGVILTDPPTTPPDAVLLRDLAAALEAEHTARVKAEGERDRDLLLDCASLDDATGLFDELIEREGIELLADGSCEYQESDCGSRLCSECGRLGHLDDYMRVQLTIRKYLDCATRFPTGGREAGVEASVRRFIKNIPSIVEDHVCGGSDTRPVVDVDGLVGGLTENAAALLPSEQKARS